MSFGLKILQGSLVIENGKLGIVEDSEKLIQDCIKIITTSQGDNPFHPGYGSLLGKSSVGQVLDASFQASIAEEYIKKSLEFLQKSQREQSFFQKLTPGEILAALQQVVVQRNQVDHRYFDIFIFVLNGKFTSQPIQFSFSNF